MLIPGESSSAHSFLCCTEVVDCCVETHVCFHVHAAPKIGHDLLDTGLEVGPSIGIILAYYLIISRALLLCYELLARLSLGP